MAEPTITNKNVPQSQSSAPSTQPQPTSSEAQIPRSQIIAKPLRSPDFINLKPKNPNISFRWVNRAVGEKESGLRYDECLAMGFQVANALDVQNCPASLVRDGRILYGDLILMKMSRADYEGALKFNEDSARRRVSRPGASLDPSKEHVIPAFSEVASNPKLAKKIQTFVPSLAEADALTNS